LHEGYATATTALDHHDAFQLLAATILSAQCTDRRVNSVTPTLFAKYPTPQALARADAADIEAIIHSTGFFRNKTKSLLGMSRALIERFDGEVPRTLEELVTLPGVARKTANVVLGTVFGIASGVVVDTHVMRLSQLLNLTRETDPVKIERELMAKIPREEWIFLGHSLILHSRAVCVARRPACDRCTLARLCPSAGNAAAVSRRRDRSDRTTAGNASKVAATPGRRSGRSTGSAKRRTGRESAE
jgi:endonuclease III